MVICPDCQLPNSPKARFCAGCGRKLQSGDSETASCTADAEPAQTMDAPPATHVPEPPPEPKLEPAPLPPSVPAQSAIAQPASAASTPATTTNHGGDVRSLVREAVADIEDAASVDTPVAIAMNFNRVLVAGHCSTAVARVENRTNQIIRDAEIVFSLKGIKEDARLFIKKLGPAQAVTNMIEMEPQKSGNFIFRCTLNCDTGEKKISLRGTRGIVVNAEPQAGNISVNVGDILANNDKNAGLASEVKISNLVDVSKIRTINDLLGMTLPEIFAPLPMELDYEISVMEERRREEATITGTSIPKEFLGHVQPASKLMLEAVSGAVRDGGMIPGIHLVARDEFGIGRDRAATDYAAWFWPCSTANNELTKRISRVHMKLVRRGSRLLIFDNGSSYGSSFEGHRTPLLPGASGTAAGAPSGAEVELSARGTIVLGHEYQLDATPFDTGLSGGLHIRNERLWPGPPRRDGERRGATGSDGERAGSVRFTPMNSETAHHGATWIFTDVTFGTSRMNPLILDLPGLAEVAGRIVYHRDQFWLESFQPEGGIAVNGHVLRPGEIVPLASGHVVRLGTTDFNAAFAPL
jgi:hypothetical protein